MIIETFNVCMFTPEYFFSHIFTWVCFSGMGGYLLYGIPRKKQVWKKCKYWVTEMWTSVNWNQERMFSELVSSRAKGRDIGRKTELKYLHSWRFRVFVMLERKHLKCLSLVEIHTLLETPHPPQIPGACCLLPAGKCSLCWQHLEDGLVPFLYSCRFGGAPGPAGGLCLGEQRQWLLQCSPRCLASR